jgi:hypothetical protein
MDAMTRHHLLRTIVLVCCLTALPCVVQAAQQDLPDLHGVIRDEAGGVLPGASVTLIDAGQQSRSVVTDRMGAYAFRRLAPGSYELSAELAGFAKVTRPITIEGSGPVSVNLRLRVSLDQRVDVVGSLEEFRRATGLGPVGLTLGPDQLGVLPNDPDAMLQVLRELSATTGRADQVTVYVDGQPVAGRLPPKAAIQSVRISTNSFASEFAEPSAGLVEIVTKPANINFRGEGQATFNDSLLNARNFFEDRRTPTRTQGYTGYIGGPIVPGHWSFLAYGGRWQRDERLVVNATVADPASPVPGRFVESVVTPGRIDSYSLRTDFIAKSRHLFSLEYARTIESYRNLGLESGLDLPERAINRDARDDAARLAVVSTFGAAVTSELRVRARERTLHERALSTAPAVLVFDAFNGGGNQASLRQEEVTRELSLTQIVSYADDLQTIRGGVQLDLLRLDERRQTNHGGTFIFGTLIDQDGRVIATPFERYLRTLNGVPGYGPSWFSIARGDPEIAFDDWQLSLFVQDDIPYTDTLTLSAGLRHGLQKLARTSWFDLAPRAGLAWTPGGSPNHVIRAALGLFYSRVPADITLDTLRYDGVAVEEFIVDRPNFFGAIPPQFNATTGRPTVRLKNRIHSPLTTSGTTSYEWQITRSLFTSVGYTYSRGDRLLRSRNINAPDPATGLAPHPDRGPMLQFESTGHSETHEFRATLRRALTRVAVFGTYIRRSSRRDTDGAYTVAADPRMLASEYGRASDDERHRAVIGSSIQLPLDVSVSTILTIGSGRPFNITTGLDDDGDLLFLDRPAAGSAGAPGVISTAFGDFDLYRDPGEPMILRNAGQGPSQFTLNMGIAKTLRLRNAPAGAPYVILSASAENLTNRANFAEFNGVVTSPAFGRANRALNPRRIELAARFGF